MKKLLLKRIYEDAHKNGGFPKLVDRNWLRRIKKTEAKIDLWLKEIAPSNELRKWFSHDHKKRNQFRTRYFKELKKQRRRTQSSFCIAGLYSKKSKLSYLFLYGFQNNT